MLRRAARLADAKAFDADGQHDGRFPRAGNRKRRGVHVERRRAGWQQSGQRLPDGCRHGPAGCGESGRIDGGRRRVAAPGPDIEPASRGLHGDSMEFPVGARIGGTEPDQVVRIALAKNLRDREVGAVRVHHRPAAGTVRQDLQVALPLEIVAGRRRSMADAESRARPGASSWPWSPG